LLNERSLGLVAGLERIDTAVAAGALELRRAFLRSIDGNVPIERARFALRRFKKPL
jgi:hypothetical protein